MEKPLRRSEHYREKAAKYHELAKFASPPYLGDFYRGVAVRYVLMAQELSRQAEKKLGLAAQPRDSHTGEVSTDTTQDLFCAILLTLILIHRALLRLGIDCRRQAAKPTGRTNHWPLSLIARGRAA